MEALKRGEGRKTRSDKKIDVRPTISISLKNHLYTFSNLCDLPVKEVIELIIERSSESKEIIEYLSKWFRRNYIFKNTLVLGDESRPRLKIIYKEETKKVTTRLKRNNYDRLCDLAFALDITPTTAVGVLIKVSLNNEDFMLSFIKTLGKTEQLRKLEKYINLMKG